MARVTLHDVNNGSSEQAGDVLTNGQFALHPVPGYSVAAAAAHVAAPGNPGPCDVKQEYHLAASSARDALSAAAAAAAVGFSPAIGQSSAVFLRGLLVF